MFTQNDPFIGGKLGLAIGACLSLGAGFAALGLGVFQPYLSTVAAGVVLAGGTIGLAVDGCKLWQASHPSASPDQVDDAQTELTTIHIITQLDENPFIHRQQNVNEPDVLLSEIDSNSTNFYLPMSREEESALLLEKNSSPTTSFAI